MLQQTTVNTVKNKFNKFILKWPTIDKLSQTSEPKILKFWSGLGYYSRARNLLKSAKIINKNFKDKIPETYEELISLPGIGDYTAKAILGIGFNKSVMPIDANIERILLRLHAIDKPITKVKKKLKYLGNKFISDKYWETNTIGCCPIAEKLETKIMQFKTNYWEEEKIQNQLISLKKTLKFFK